MVRLALTDGLQRKQVGVSAGKSMTSPVGHFQVLMTGQDVNSECAFLGSLVPFPCSFPGLAACLLSQGGPASQGGSEGCAGSQLSRWSSASTTSIPVSPALQRGRQQGVAQVLGGVQLSLVSMTNFTTSDLGQPGRWTVRDSVLSLPFSS